MESNIPEQPSIQPISPEMPPQQSASRSYMPLLLFFVLAIGIVGALFALLLFKSASYQAPSPMPTKAVIRQATTISGLIAFEGYIPQGSYISIAERNETEGTQQYKEIVTGLVPKDGIIPFTWTDATKGQNYLLKALFKVQGKAIQESPIIDVSAPATNVVINLSSQQQPPAPTTATLSGQINLDGYAPAGSSLQVLARTVTNPTYQIVAQNITPVDNANWTWTNALLGTTYLVKAQLVNTSGTIISKGDIDTTTAPSTSEVLNVASTAQPPAPTVSGISGTITINGNIPSNSYITLGVRPSGTSTFNQVANNISATSGVAFSYTNANSSQSYDVQAYLWSNGKPYAQSNILTVVAPSTFNVLTINAQQPTQAPLSGTMNVSCGGKQGGLAQATINFNTQSNLANAQSYNVVVTSATQNTQVVNTTVNPPNPTSSQSITTTFVFQPGATYYAQYAYSTSTGGQMSPLSPSIQFACQ